MQVESCPSCSISLRLFTPRECEKHVNECLDAGTPEKGERPECAVCGKDLFPLTKAAREEHANRCADSLLPKKPRPVRGTSRLGSAATGGAGILPQCPPVELDPKVKSFLDALGLARYAPKFAAEEIDLDALRLLTDNDLTALRIPDAARRRIAEAMHSVAVLNKIAGEDSLEISPDMPVQLTQNFQESRIFSGVSHRTAKIIDNESDDEDDDLSGIYDCQDTESPAKGIMPSPAESPSLPDGSPLKPKNMEKVVPDDEIGTGQDDGNLGRSSIEGNQNPGKNLFDSDDEDFESPFLRKLHKRRGEKPTHDGVAETEPGRNSRAGSSVEKNDEKDDSGIGNDNDESATANRTPRVRPPPSKLIVNSQSQNVQDVPQLDVPDVELDEPEVDELEAELEDDSNESDGGHGPETISELEEWAAEKRREENERHERALNDIDSKYQRMKRKLEDKGDHHVEERLVKKPRPVISNSPIDLTLDDTPVKENDPSPPKTLTTKPQDSPKLQVVEKPVSKSRRSEGKLKSSLAEDSSSEETSSDEEVLNFSKRLAKILPHRKTVSSAGTVAGTDRSVLSDDDGRKVQSEQAACDFSPQISVDGIVQVEDTDDEINADVVPPISNPAPESLCDDHVGTQSSDELMDLTQPMPNMHEPEPQYRLNLDELNTRASCTNANAFPPSAPVQRVAPSLSVPSFSLPVDPSALAASQGRTGGPPARKSRLRKSKKVTTSELRTAIRADPKLLDDVLMMKTVEFERVMASVKSFGLKPTTKGLYDFLTAEGILFKEVAPPTENQTQKASKFFTSLATQGFY